MTRLTQPPHLNSNFVYIAQNAKQMSDAQQIPGTGASGQLGSLSPGGGGSSSD